jgi:hypothetical protein
LTDPAAKLLEREKEKLKARTRKKPNVWAAYGLAEMVPRPSPFAFALIDGITARYGGWGRAFSELGFRYHGALSRHGFYTTICGRLYVSLEREAMTYFGSLPLEHPYDELLQDPAAAFYHRPRTKRK